MFGESVTQKYVIFYVVLVVFSFMLLNVESDFFSIFLFKMSIYFLKYIYVLVIVKHPQVELMCLYYDFGAVFGYFSDCLNRTILFVCLSCVSS